MLQFACDSVIFEPCFPNKVSRSFDLKLSTSALISYDSVCDDIMRLHHASLTRWCTHNAQELLLLPHLSVCLLMLFRQLHMLRLLLQMVLLLLHMVRPLFVFPDSCYFNIQPKFHNLVSSCVWFVGPSYLFEDIDLLTNKRR